MAPQPDTPDEEAASPTANLRTRRKRQIAIAAAPVLELSRLGVFRLLARLLDPELGWYAGFFVY